MMFGCWYPRKKENIIGTKFVFKLDKKRKVVRKKI